MEQCYKDLMATHTKMLQQFNDSIKKLEENFEKELAMYRNFGTVSEIAYLVVFSNSAMEVIPNLPNGDEIMDEILSQSHIAIANLSDMVTEDYLTSQMGEQWMNQDFPKE